VAALAVLLAGTPLLFVAKAVESRYALVPWVLLALAMLPALRAAPPRRAAGLAVLGAVLLALTAVPTWRGSMARLERMSAEGRFLSGMTPGDALRAPLSPPSALGPLHVQHGVLFGRESTADWFDDDLYLCGHQPRRIWTWSDARGGLVEADAAVRRAAAALCADLPVTAPLEASFRWRRGTLAWRLGPYRDGDYAFLLDSGRQAIPVPPVGGYRLGGASALELRIRHRAPDGRVVYSEPIRLQAGGGPVEYRQPRAGRPPAP
jgi:hypothetical protein